MVLLHLWYSLVFGGRGCGCGGTYGGGTGWYGVGSPMHLTAADSMFPTQSWTPYPVCAHCSRVCSAPVQVTSSIQTSIRPSP